MTRTIIASIIIGAALTTIESSVQLPFAPAGLGALLPVALASGFFTAFAMGMDVPKSNVRFGRLTG